MLFILFSKTVRFLENRLLHGKLSLQKPQKIANLYNLQMGKSHKDKDFFSNRSNAF